MGILSSTLSKALASAIVATSALGGCAMMCGACSGRKCGTKTTMHQCGACKAKCGACGAKK